MITSIPYQIRWDHQITGETDVKYCKPTNSFEKPDCGDAKESDFELVEVPLPELEEGEVLVQTFTRQ